MYNIYIKSDLKGPSRKLAIWPIKYNNWPIYWPK